MSLFLEIALFLHMHRQITLKYFCKKFTLKNLGTYLIHIRVAVHTFNNEVTTNAITAILR